MCTNPRNLQDSRRRVCADSEHDHKAQRKLLRDQRRRDNFHNAPGPFEKAEPGDALYFVKQRQGRHIVSRLSHYADVMRLSLREALKERAGRAECVREIRRVQMKLQSWLKEETRSKGFHDIRVLIQGGV